MAVLLLADHDNASLNEATARALTAARQIDPVVHVLITGENARAAAEAAAMLDGVDKILLVDSRLYGHGLAEAVAERIVSLAPNYEAIVSAATTHGKNVLPRVAALLDVAQVSDLVRVASPKTFERPTYAGNVMVTVEATDPTVVATVRTAAFDPTPAGPSAAPIEVLDAGADSGLSLFVSEVVARSERPELATAKIVVSGGRALSSAEQFTALIAPLADRLGAAVGASRAAVDAGFAPNDWQVGQTGKVIAPDLYIAIGISGAIQHLAGMKDSKIIVAINKDEEAPIFQIADYGLVGDLFDVVPELAREIDAAARA